MDYRRSPLFQRRLIAIALFSSVFALGGLASSALADDETLAPATAAEESTTRILGHWQRGKGEAIIEISERTGVYSGVIVWSQKRPETVGIEVFRELRYDSKDGEWHGRAYSIKRKREVPVDIRVLAEDQLELTAHILIFTRDVEFSRVPTAKAASLRAKQGL